MNDAFEDGLVVRKELAFMLHEERWRRRCLEKGDEGIITELCADFGLRERSPEQAVRGLWGTLDEFGDPPSVSATNGGMCAYCGR